MNNKGFLAIWCEIGSEDLADYRAWITREHIADRTRLPGWLGARFCTDLSNERAHFFLYATEGPQVFSAPPYLEVLNNPSPWTKRLMPRFGPFDRALGEQLFKLGNGQGAVMVVSRVRDTSGLDLGAVRTRLSGLMDEAGVISVRLMRLDRSSTDIASQEKTMRRGIEGDFHYLLVVECLSAPDGLGVQARLGEVLAEAFPEASSCDSSVRQVIYADTAFEAATAP